MIYVEAFSTEHKNHILQVDDEQPVIFLAGGITGCEDWQSKVVNLLSDLDITLVNPRRKNWVDSEKEATRQIEWEFEHLYAADNILFWFPHETLCPITLFEYGKWIVSKKRMFVGYHRDYKRSLDLDVQSGLERPKQRLHNSLESLCDEVREIYG